MREYVRFRPAAAVTPAGRDRPLLPLKVQDLSLTLGGRARIDRLKLDLGAVGATVILGPNGAGKSLLLKLLHGIAQPDAGRIDWNGLPPEAATHRQALVFQRPVLLRRTAAANLDFVLRARGGDRSRVAELLAHVGLADRADQPARRLSGGEQQRLALARALATDPEVLFLDEPTASLDPASTLAIERIVSGARARGMRVIFVSHDVAQARRLADDVVFMEAGRVCEHRAAQDFFDSPESAGARAFLEGRLPES